MFGHLCRSFHTWVLRNFSFLAKLFLLSLVFAEIVNVSVADEVPESLHQNPMQQFGLNGPNVDTYSAQSLQKSPLVDQAMAFGNNIPDSRLLDEKDITIRNDGREMKNGVMHFQINPMPSYTLSDFGILAGLRRLLEIEGKERLREGNKEGRGGDSNERKSDVDQDSKLKEDAEDTVEDVDDILHKLEKSKKGNLDFFHALVASFSVIIVSEIGDKTFFIAAILAMRNSRLTILLGALSALVVMTVMSALVGYATTVVPRAFTYYVSSILFAIFGLKMLKEAWGMSPDEGQEEYEEAQAEIKKKEEERLHQNTSVQDVETGIIRTPGRRFLSGILSAIFLESFTLTFLAEWGDRSQIATIILGAREDVVGVMIGGFVGHALCTGLAVIGGRFVAQRISVRTVTYIGGAVFLIFAASALFIGPDS